MCNFHSLCRWEEEYAARMDLQEKVAELEEVKSTLNHSTIWSIAAQTVHTSGCKNRQAVFFLLVTVETP